MMQQALVRAALITLLGFSHAIAASAAAEGDETVRKWTGEVALSFAAQTGTVDTLNGDLDAKLERSWERDVASARVTGAFGQTRDRNDDPSGNQTTQNSQGLFLNHTRTISHAYLWRSALELSRDPTVDREVRFVVATGPGYLLWEGEKADKQRFEGRVGMGYRYELFDGNTGPDPETGLFDRSQNGYDANLVDGILSFEYRNLFFEGAMEWTHTGSAAMPFNDVAAYLIRTEGIIGIPLTATWSFRASVLFEYNNNAPDNQNKALTRSVVGLGYKF